jgi:putative metallohydrolase (TIGR04338 family)
MAIRRTSGLKRLKRTVHSPYSSEVKDVGRDILITIRPQWKRNYSAEDRPGVFGLPSERWWKNGTRPKRDSMRAKCYGAEDAIRLEVSQRDLSDLEEAARYLRDTMETDWFQRRWPKFRELTIHYVPQVKGANAMATHWGYDKLPNRGRINCGKWALTKELVWLHELAHCIIPPGHHHDRLWVRTFLELVRLRMGKDAHERLRDSFRKHRVKFNPYRQLSEEHKAKLAACRPSARRVS